MNQFNRGLTLIEILIVIAILATFIIVIAINSQGVFRQTRARKIVSDIGTIKNAFQRWHFDADVPYINEECIRNPSTCNISGMTQNQCADEPFIESVLITPPPANLTPNPAEWNGPYLKQTPVDPYGNHYSYDVDYEAFGGACGSGEICVPLDRTGFCSQLNKSRGDGVNIALNICSNSPQADEYLSMAPIINDIIDSGETGLLPTRAAGGQFRWRLGVESLTPTPPYYSYFFLVANSCDQL